MLQFLKLGKSHDAYCYLDSQIEVNSFKFVLCDSCCEDTKDGEAISWSNWYTTHRWCSPSAVPWTWTAYCKFQRMSSNDGRLHDSEHMHLFVMVTTIDRDSCEHVARTIGLNNFWRPSWLLQDAWKIAVYWCQCLISCHQP
jgi:hypothetical protein